MAANMSLAAVAVRNQRKKQKVPPAQAQPPPPLPILPSNQLPGGPALLVLELGRLAAAKRRKGSDDSQMGSNSGSVKPDEVTKAR